MSVWGGNVSNAGGRNVVKLLTFSVVPRQEVVSGRTLIIVWLLDELEVLKLL